MHIKLWNECLGDQPRKSFWTKLHDILFSILANKVYNLSYTLLGSVYLRVIFNLSYTFLGSVYLRIHF